jgi:hypothetical protein
MYSSGNNRRTKLSPSFLITVYMSFIVIYMFRSLPWNIFMVYSLNVRRTVEAAYDGIFQDLLRSYDLHHLPSQCNRSWRISSYTTSVLLLTVILYTLKIVTEVTETCIAEHTLLVCVSLFAGEWHAPCTWNCLFRRARLSSNLTLMLQTHVLAQMLCRRDSKLGTAS